jgi:hypothetical protein
MKRRTEITIEKHRLVYIGGRKISASGWCEPCGQQVELITPDAAAQSMGISARIIYRHVEAGAIHFTEIQDGHLLVCRNSLAERVIEDQETNLK